jgi:thioredoxin-dependent peroxiredoxin
MKLLAGIVVIIAAAVVVYAWNNAGASEPPQAGLPAPDFSLPSQDGSVVGLKDFRGKWVVLYFYPKDNTHGCTIEAHNFQRDLEKYTQNNAVVVGVSVDSTGSHQDFCAKQGLTFKLLADTGKKVSAEYGSLRNLVAVKISARNTFLIDPDGKIAKVWIGVDPGKHSEEVLTALVGLNRKS